MMTRTKTHAKVVMQPLTMTDPFIVPSPLQTHLIVLMVPRDRKKAEPNYYIDLGRPVYLT
jgi:hypothetical protein